MTNLPASASIGGSPVRCTGPLFAAGELNR
jgi:hypothetical protein